MGDASNCACVGSARGAARRAYSQGVSKYFAYGSNMAAAVIEAACPRHRYLGRARLPRHRLAFTRRSVRTGTGVADLLPDPEGSAWGVLYELGAEGLAALDRKEGAGWAYERRDVRVFSDDDTAHEAVAYFVIAKSPEPIEPSAGYLAALLDAGRERELPAEHLTAVECSARPAC